MFGAILIGGPFENKRHIENNMAFTEHLMRKGPGMITIAPSIVMPYPLTDIGMNPEKYGLVITDPDGLRSFSDYPVMRSEEMSERDILAAYMNFIHFTRDVVQKTLEENAISHEALMRSFKGNMGSESIWKSVILNLKPQMGRFYDLLTRGAGHRLKDVPEAELPEWRPQRMVEMWHDVSFKEGYPVLAQEALSPFEFDILKFSTGKQTVGEIAARLYGVYGEPFGETDGEFFGRVAEQLKRFGDKYQMIAVPY
jgi:hypothetical protein